jgi:hypothetical protein
MFDLEGNNRWPNADLDEVSYDYWINNSKTDYDASITRECLVYPKKYITPPSNLDKLNLDTGNIKSDSTCNAN